MSSPPKRSDEDTSFTSVTSPEYDIKGKAGEEREKKRVKTDFHAINKELDTDRRRTHQKQTLTDQIIDFTTPFLIFVMVLIVVWFLLDVRYIFTEVDDGYYRVIAFCLVMGIVASNRLIAEDDSAESWRSVIVLMGVSFMAPWAFNIYSGSVARGFLSGPLIGGIFNSVIVGFLWWMTNRLVHECCVDENQIAGDVGILTGTLRNVQRAIQPGSQRQVAMKKRTDSLPKITKRPKGHILETEEIVAVDPHDYVPPSKNEEKELYIPPTKRLSRRHPGVSIFYFSVPSLIIFAIGLPVLMQGGQRFIFKGHVYVAVFTFSALTLLMLTSLAGIRQYFRSRNVHLPPMIGAFWFSVGMVMVAMVMFGAIRLPMPPMPPMLHVAEHETDYFTRTSTFKLKSEQFHLPDYQMEAERTVNAVSNVVLGLFALVILFALLRAVGSYAAFVGRRRDQFPPWVVDAFNALDRFLVKYVRLPAIKARVRQGRMPRSLAQSGAFSSNMRGQASANRGETESYVAHAYDALCALAYDMGVPKKDDQTPYEFIESFPKELESLKEDARVLTDLYVRAAYSQLEMDSRTLDLLRQFWFAYDTARGRVVR